MLFADAMPFLQPSTRGILHENLLPRQITACLITAYLTGSLSDGVDLRLFRFLLFLFSVFGQSSHLLYMHLTNSFAEIVALTDEDAMVSANTKYGPGLWVMLTVVFEA